VPEAGDNTVYGSNVWSTTPATHFAHPDTVGDDGNSIHNQELVSIRKRLPPYSDDPPPYYIPPYPRAGFGDLEVFIRTDGDLGNGDWDLVERPVDGYGRPIELYPGRLLCVNDQERAQVFCCQEVSEEFVVMTAFRFREKSFHTLWVRKEWVDGNLRELICLREGRGEVELEWGQTM
jgi:hypothetical protein